MFEKQRARFTYDDYSTHQPVLYEAVKRTDGPVVEFGCGYGSTPMLHSLCGGRKLLSLESDREWLEKFLEYGIGSHTLKLVGDWNALLSSDMIRGDWSVALIDNWSWDDRRIVLMGMKDKAHLIVLHDCDYFSKRGIQFDEVFKYHKIFLPLKPWPYRPTGPPTLLGSNFENCDWDIDYEDYVGMECML